MGIFGTFIGLIRKVFIPQPEEPKIVLEEEALFRETIHKGTEAEAADGEIQRLNARFGEKVRELTTTMGETLERPEKVAVVVKDAETLAGELRKEITLLEEEKASIQKLAALVKKERDDHLRSLNEAFLAQLSAWDAYLKKIIDYAQKQRAFLELDSPSPRPAQAEQRSELRRWLSAAKSSHLSVNYLGPEKRADVAVRRSDVYHMLQKILSKKAELLAALQEEEKGRMAQAAA